PFPHRSFTNKIFWFTLNTLTNGVARFWPNPTQYEPVVERVRVPVADLPAALRGLTIAHLSDFHAGPHVHAETIRHAAQMTMALKPDLIALTGDFVHRQVEYATDCADALSILRAPLGVHVVLGNHDYWRDHLTVERELRRVGLKPMHNTSHRLTRNGTALYVVGVDDVRFRRADLARALREVPADAPTILLVHEPDFADFAHDAHSMVQLSGHSHGGQIRVPCLGALLLPSWGRKYPMGLRRTPRGAWVYTTRGIGVAMPPVRLNCPPEISLLTLEVGS
ncbi:MAG: metallophosphoesterase, partial [Chloroflexota bacterium]